MRPGARRRAGGDGDAPRAPVARRGRRSPPPGARRRPRSRSVPAPRAPPRARGSPRSRRRRICRAAAPGAAVGLRGRSAAAARGGSAPAPPAPSGPSIRLPGSLAGRRVARAIRTSRPAARANRVATVKQRPTGVNRPPAKGGGSRRSRSPGGRRPSRAGSRRRASPSACRGSRAGPARRRARRRSAWRRRGGR